MSDGVAENFLIAQNVICGYPISDVYAPTPRYLFYALLACSFLTLRYKGFSHVFTGAAAAYAATAAIHAIIIVSRPSIEGQAEVISIPFISPDDTSMTDAIGALVTNATQIVVQPDAIELDIDAITAVVVSAYLVGLPLQIWSRTVLSSRIVRYMIMFWNVCMLVGTISALIAWPTTNLVSPQYRFCFSQFLDPDSQNSPGWDPTIWRGSWNATISNIFQDEDSSAWQKLSDNCINPCFNTTQVIRQSSSLRSTVALPGAKFAKIHSNHPDGEVFRPLIYTSIIIFTGVQVFLTIVSALHGCSDPVRRALHDPHRIWTKRKAIVQRISEDSVKTWQLLTGSAKPEKKEDGTAEKDHGSGTPTFRVKDLGRFLLDLTVLFMLIIAALLFPVVIVAFICWIEWYIRNDGAPNETITQVGQWAPLVSVGVVLCAVCAYQFKDQVASQEEMRGEIAQNQARIVGLQKKLRSQTDVPMSILDGRTL